MSTRSVRTSAYGKGRRLDQLMLNVFSPTAIIWV